MPLAICTPTRRRWPWLIEQASAIAPQLAPGDLWLIGCDCDRGPDGLAEHLMDAGVPVSQTIFLDFDYHRGDGHGSVNRIRNALAAFAPPTHDIVEVDDHDPLEPYALSEIRHAFDAGYDYVFGWHKQRALIVDPGGTESLEPWPTVERTYERGDFGRGAVDAIAVRAIRRRLWTSLGGWSGIWPGGDKDLALRAEAIGATITCLPRPLCAVTIDPAGIVGHFHPLPHKPS